MMKKKQFSREFKAKVALASLRDDATIAEISSRYKVHSNQISKWKKIVRDGSGNLFAGRKSAGQDEQYTRTPFYGVPKMTQFLRDNQYNVGRDRVRTLLRRMGLFAIYPKPYR